MEPSIASARPATLHPTPPAVTFEGVGHDYGRTVALDGFDLSVAPGEVVAVLGPNGAGKTAARPAASSLTVARLARMLRIEIGAELPKHLRLPIYAVSTIAFPVMFYSLFASMQNGEGPVHVPTYMLATYGAFGVIGASLFAFGASVAVERAQGWMRLKRASPLPGAVTVVARLANALVFSAAIVAVLLVVGTLVAGVRLTAGEVLGLFGVDLLAALPFCVIGQCTSPPRATSA